MYTHRVTAYEANDGTIHRTEKEAKLHNFNTEIQILFPKRIGLYVDGRYWPAEIAEILLKNKNKVIALLESSN